MPQTTGILQGTAKVDLCLDLSTWISEGAGPGRGGGGGVGGPVVHLQQQRGEVKVFPVLHILVFELNVQPREMFTLNFCNFLQILKFNLSSNLILI